MIARLTGLWLGALASLAGAHAQQPVTPGQIAPYVDTIFPRPSLPPGPEPLDQLYPPPLRPAPLPDRSVPVPPPYPELTGPRSSPLLPQGFTMTVPRSAHPTEAGPLRRGRDVGERLAACWSPPASGSEATVRVAFDRHGRLLGAVQVTYIKPVPGADRAAIRASVDRALEHCLPLQFTPDLGSAIAGRPFTIRLVAGDGDRP
jgi:hypothetical protein